MAPSGKAPKRITATGLVIASSLLVGGCADNEASAEDLRTTSTSSGQLQAPDASTKRKPPKDVLRKPTKQAPRIETTYFLGQDESQTRKALREGQIVSVTRGKGGRSLGFKIRLDTGVSAYFKPEQNLSNSHWYAELTAYYLDRMLGFGRVPTTVGRRFAWKDLRAAAGSDPRISKLAIDENGMLRGALIVWLDRQPFPMREIGRDWEHIIRMEDMVGSTPYQRAADTNRRRGEREIDSLKRAEHIGPWRAKELSDVIVFDYLIANFDRWGGDFTNLRTYGRGGQLLFFDNGDGMTGRTEPPIIRRRLDVCQKFSRRTFDALEDFEIEELELTMSQDELAPILSEEKLAQIATRVKNARAHIRKNLGNFGEEIFFEDPED